MIKKQVGTTTTIKTGLDYCAPSVRVVRMLDDNDKETKHLHIKQSNGAVSLSLESLKALVKWAEEE